MLQIKGNPAPPLITIVLKLLLSVQACLCDPTVAYFSVLAQVLISKEGEAGAEGGSLMPAGRSMCFQHQPAPLI